MAVDQTAAVFDSGAHMRGASSSEAPAMVLVTSLRVATHAHTQPRPDEIDNSSLQDPQDLSALSASALYPPAASAGDRVVFLTASTWFAITGIYGGGPEFPRRVRSIADVSSTMTAHGSTAPPKLESASDISAIRMVETVLKVDVDLAPNVLQGYWCAASGHPCAFHGKSLVSKGGDARELIKWALRDLGVFDSDMTGGGTGGDGAMIGVNDINVWVLRDVRVAPDSGTRIQKGMPSIETVKSADMPHFDLSVQLSKSASTDNQESGNRPDPDGWRLEYDDVFERRRDSAQSTASASTPLTSKRWLRHGPETYWHLIDGDLRSAPLERIGVLSGSIVMFESKCIAAAATEPEAAFTGGAFSSSSSASWIWPTERVQEGDAFREIKLWQWVDVLNYRGKWCVAQVVRLFLADNSDEPPRRSSRGDLGPVKAIDASGDPTGADEVQLCIGKLA